MTEVLSIAIAFYLSCGILFCSFFLLKGPGKMDPDAANTGIGFKLIILPGVIVLWPLLLKKFLSAFKEPGND